MKEKNEDRVIENHQINFSIEIKENKSLSIFYNKDIENLIEHKLFAYSVVLKELFDLLPKIQNDDLKDKIIMYQTYMIGAYEALEKAKIEQNSNLNSLKSLL